MRLEQITIENFRRIKHAEICLAPASFIIGPNNCGKSSVIAAIDALLSLEKEKVILDDFRLSVEETRSEKIILTGVFSSIAPEVARGKGFRGRVINGTYTYRKTFSLSGSKAQIECLQYPSTIKDEYKSAKTVNDLLLAGINLETIKEALRLNEPSEKLKRGWENDLPEVLEFDNNASPIWFTNPGGIPTIVQSRLPKVLRIPSYTNLSDFSCDDKKYILGECLSILFDDLMRQTPLANEIQEKLDQLEAKMEPSSEDSLISIMCVEVNKIIKDVFPECGIKINPSLQGVTDILKPKYQINFFSNVSTDAQRQGTGLIRTTAFAMLRYHSKIKFEKEIQTRPILVAFEEPEIYLHPQAANLLRETIYGLGRSDQIICTTHSPWMIDLSKEPLSLTRMIPTEDNAVSAINYGVSTSFAKLEPDHKDRVKMLQFFDDELSRVFFSEKTVIVEGDSELLAIKGTLPYLPENIQKDIYSRFQIVKARGKASIISLVKYLQDLGIFPIVMHDRDNDISGAVVFNPAIAEAVNDPNRTIVLMENLENSLGYEPPSKDKPFRAFKQIQKWSKLTDIPETWLTAISQLFQISGISPVNSGQMSATPSVPVMASPSLKE